MKNSACELCASDGGRLILSNEVLRVVMVDEPDFPGLDGRRRLWQLTKQQSARKRIRPVGVSSEAARHPGAQDCSKLGRQKAEEWPRIHRAQGGHREQDVQRRAETPGIQMPRPEPSLLGGIFEIEE